MIFVLLFVGSVYAYQHHAYFVPVGTNSNSQENLDFGSDTSYIYNESATAPWTDDTFNMSSYADIQNGTHKLFSGSNLHRSLTDERHAGFYVNLTHAVYIYNFTFQIYFAVGGGEGDTIDFTRVNYTVTIYKSDYNGEILYNVSGYDEWDYQLYISGYRNITVDIQTLFRYQLFFVVNLTPCTTQDDVQIVAGYDYGGDGDEGGTSYLVLQNGVWVQKYRTGVGRLYMYGFLGTPFQRGFSEDFSDVSDWTVTTTDASLTSDGDIGNWTIVGTGNNYYIYRLDWVSVYNYPFLEFQYRTGGTVTYGFQLKVTYDLNNDGVSDGYIEKTIPLSSTWRLYRINLYELLRENGITVDSNTRVRPHFRRWVGAGVTSIILFDYMREYSMTEWSYTSYSWQQSGISSACYVYSNSDYLIFHMYFDQSGTFEVLRLTNMDISWTHYLTFEVKGYIYMAFYDTATARWYIFINFYDDFTIVTIDTSQYSFTTLLLGVVDDINPPYRIQGSATSISSLSGSYETYIRFLTVSSTILNVTSLNYNATLVTDRNKLSISPNLTDLSNMKNLTNVEYSLYDENQTFLTNFNNSVVIPVGMNDSFYVRVNRYFNDSDYYIAILDNETLFQVSFTRISLEVINRFEQISMETYKLEFQLRFSHNKSIIPNANIYVYINNSLDLITRSDDLGYCTYYYYFGSNLYWNITLKIVKGSLVDYPMINVTRNAIITKYDYMKMILLNPHGDIVDFDTVKVYVNGSRIYYDTVFARTDLKYNITVKDRFDSVLYSGVYDYDREIVITLALYTLKFANRNSTFVHVNISRYSLHFSEWLAYGEVAKYYLHAGTYNLTVRYLDGSILETSITVQNDTYFILTGNTLADILTNLEFVQSNISYIQSQNTWIMSNQTIMIGNITINQGILNNTLGNVTINQAYLQYIQGNLTVINATIWTVYGNITIINATLDRIEDEILRLFNHLRINLYNNLTGLGLDFQKFKVFVNDTRVYHQDYYTLSNYTKVVVMDYFNRTIYNHTVYTNQTLDIGVPVGTLSILNNNSFSVRLVINATNNASIEIVLKPYESVSLELVFSNYTLDVYRIIYDENTGLVKEYVHIESKTISLDMQSEALTLDYEEPALVRLNWEMMILFGALGGLGGILIKIFWRKILDVLAWIFGWKKRDYRDFREV